VLHQVEVLLVDDGSTDGTFIAVSGAFIGAGGPRLRFGVARHRQNRGLGAAMRTGFASAGGEVIVTIDSDGSYAFDEIPALVACLDSGVDLVTGSPYHRRGRAEAIPFHRLLLSRGCSLIYRFLVDWRIRTYTSIFRAYRRRVVENTPFEGDGYHAVTELLVKAILQGYRAAEYPTVLRKRSVGTSKSQLAHTLLGHLRFQGFVLLDRLGLRPLIRRAEESRAPS
jgi:dolichol-phosphate mannosyltransferase